VNEFYHKFGGKRYVIDVHHPFDGICDPPEGTSQPAIRLPNGLQDTRKCLIILLHEVIHACDWNKSEPETEEMANDIGKLLWKLGYRRIKE
jgi:hypothetical protein